MQVAGACLFCSDIAVLVALLIKLEYKRGCYCSTILVLITFKGSSTQKLCSLWANRPFEQIVLIGPVGFRCTSLLDGGQIGAEI